MSLKISTYNGNSFDEKFINVNNISTKYITEDLFNITENVILFSWLCNKNFLDFFSMSLVIIN